MVAALASGGAFAPVAVAQRTGVLIAIEATPAANPYADDGDITTVRYETLWIVRDVRQPLRTTIPDIVVPRANGFWRVGIVASCTFDARALDASATDVFWEAPVDSTAVIPTDDRCARPDSAVSRPSKAAPTDTTQCGYATLAFSFVSPAYVSLRETNGQWERCEPRGGRTSHRVWVRRFDRDTAIALDAIAGPGARTAYMRAIGGPAHADSAFHCEPLTRTDFDASWLRSWYIGRGGGRWLAIAFQQPSLAFCQYEGTIAVTLPRAVVGGNAATPLWSAVRAAVPGVLDAFTAPAGDLTIGVTRDSLVVFASAGSVLGRRIFSRGVASPNVVMIQWASGAQVDSWDRALAALAASNRPGARLVRVPR
jgi:hypothetical protein